MKNINRLPIYRLSVKRAAGPLALVLAQAIVLNLPAYAGDALISAAKVGSLPLPGAVLPGAVLPGVQAALQAAPPAFITDAAPNLSLSNKSMSSDIDNFDIVSKGLWRGALPSHRAIANLAKNGVKTIIDLRYAGPGVKEEALVAKQYGINCVNIPLGFEHPSLTNVAKFLAIVSKPANQPVFIHCRQGADRTGTLVGIFRILHDHWSFTEAYNEMRVHHFKPFLGNLKSLVARCDVDPNISRKLTEMASKLEETATLPKLSVKSAPGNM